MNCVLLAIYSIRADKDILDVYETVATNRPIWEGDVWSFGDLADYICRCSLPHVCIEGVKLGGRYLQHADGREDEPHFLSMFFDKEGSAAISTGVANYAREIQAVNDLLSASVDKPMALAFASPFKPSASSGSRGIACETDGLMKLQECSRSARGVGYSYLYRLERVGVLIKLCSSVALIRRATH